MWHKLSSNSLHQMQVLLDSIILYQESNTATILDLKLEQWFKSISINQYKSGIDFTQRPSVKAPTRTEE